MATIQQIIANANVIKNETTTGANTAVRVGTNLVDIATDYANSGLENRIIVIKRRI